MPGLKRKLLIAVFTAILLSGCKVLVVVPEGGSVKVASGGGCPAQTQGELEVLETDYDEIFTAIPSNLLCLSSKPKDLFVASGW